MMHGDNAWVNLIWMARNHFVGRSFLWPRSWGGVQTGGGLADAPSAGMDALFSCSMASECREKDSWSPPRANQLAWAVALIANGGLQGW